MDRLSNLRISYRVAYYAALAISSLLLIIPAFYNRYPLMNPDTATYLASGFKPETPFDRPITYGILIRLFSLNGASLWFLVFIQAWIVSWLIFKIIKNFSGNKPYVLKSLCISGFLAVGSSLSWLVSQVQPDLYTSVAVLCIILILMNKEGKVDKWLLYLLFFIAVAVHMSHPLLFCLMAAVLFCAASFFSEKENLRIVRQKALLLIFLSALSFVVMGSAFSKSKHVFFMGSLLEKGILKKYLNDNCAVKNYKLCAYKDELPLKSDDFIWVDSSPLYKVGSWKGSKEEFNNIIQDILTTPKYLQMFISATVRQAGAQACAINIGDGNSSFPPGSNVNQRVSEYFPGEVTRFNNDRQNIRTFENNLQLPNFVFTAIVIISILVLAILFFTCRFKSKDMRLIAIVCLAGILLNCLDCAAFSVVNGRFGCKMIWLLPFCSVLLIAFYDSPGTTTIKRPEAALFRKIF